MRAVRFFAGGVFWQLRLIGITLSNDTHCGIEEHIHEESCMEQMLVCGRTESTESTENTENTENPEDPILNCSLSEHAHGDACYSERQTLCCDLGHTHGDGCYTEERTLVCETEEGGHIHDDGCYTEEQKLVCESTEEGHEHSGACYETDRVLSCGQEEGHRHGASCYLEEKVLSCETDDSHVHTEACYRTEQVLTCTEEPHTHDESCWTAAPVPEEHTHTDACYKMTYTCGLKEHTHTAACYSDPDADVETADIWESTLPDSELIGVWADDLLLVAESQLGYTESEENYVEDEESGELKGYTRYGEWYGNLYGDWNAMFAAFCLHYAGVTEETLPYNSGVHAWTVELGDLYLADENGEPGDLVFFDTDGDGKADDVGILFSDGGTIRGNVEGAVAVVEAETPCGYVDISAIAEAAAAEKAELPTGAEVASCTCGSETDEHAEDCPLYVELEQTFFDQLMLCGTLADMFELLCSDIDAAYALTAGEIDGLEQRATELYETNGDEDGYYQELLDTFTYLRGLLNGRTCGAAEGEAHETWCPMNKIMFYAAPSGTPLPSSYTGGMLTAGTYYIDGDNKVLSSTVVISGNVILDLNGFVLQGNGKDPVITVPSGATLTIRDSNETSGHAGNMAEDVWLWSEGNYPLGGGIIYNQGTGKGIIVNGTLNFENGKVAGCKSTGNGAGVTVNSEGVFNMSGGLLIGNSANRGGGICAESKAVVNISGGEIKRNYAANSGGGIFINKPSDSSTEVYCTISDCDISYNLAGVCGGGIFSYASTNISDTVISYNAAMETEDGEVAGGNGRGGGFYFAGTSTTTEEGYDVATYSPVSTLTNVTVTNNSCMYYGGGGQVCSGAELTLVSGRISENTAVLHGAGGLHVTAAAKFTLQGGEISNNLAYYVGGGIHSSYSCVLNLIGGEIKNNTVYGRGGGVHVNVGGNLHLQGTNITGNRALDGANCLTGTVTRAVDGSCSVDESSVTVSGSIPGYGGGVTVDACTLTMTAGEVSGNHAQTGGGGIALVMINPAAGHKKFPQNRVVEFTLTDGTVEENTTDGNGAGIYLMKNKLTREELQKALEAGSWPELDADADGVVDEAYGENGLVGSPKITATGGTVRNNIAQGNGGAAYQEEGTIFTISGTADFSGNEAKQSGGAVYIAQGTANINGGSVSENTAIMDGGALYINGTVNMTDGSVTGNTATNGGAVYVTGGDFIMSHGVINENSATYTQPADSPKTENNGGGAVYVNGGNLTMTSGTMDGNTSADDGGAIYAVGGVIKIGRKGCTHNTPCQDHEEGNTAGHYHPLIQNNTAADCGGGIAVAQGGAVHLYCCDELDNSALFKGVGKGIFMAGGEIFVYDGATVSLVDDPDLVIVGGTLHDERIDTTESIELIYHEDNLSTANPFTGTATLNSYMNLPEDGQYFFAPRTGYSFVGWTSQGAGGSLLVRDKSQYLPSGDPVKITDTEADCDPAVTFDGTSDGDMHLYGLWAPDINDITLVDGMTNQVFAADAETVTGESNPASYTFSVTEQTVDIHAYPKPEGYAVVGWYIYQNTDKNANWGFDYDPEYKEGYTTGYENLDLDNFDSCQYLPLDEPGETLKLNIEGLTFGDITLIAKYEQQFKGLIVTKQVENAAPTTQEFVFELSVILEGEAYTEPLSLTGSEDTLAAVDGVYTFNLTQDETIHIQLPWTSSYTLTETEASAAGFYTSVETGETWLVGRTVTGDMNEDVAVLFTNSAGYTLPETGGSGTIPYTLGGLLMCAAAVLLLYCRNRHRKEDFSSS